MTRAAQLELAIVAVAILTLGLVAAALMDVVRRPAQQWAASGRRKELWIALLLMSTAIPIPLIVLPVWYLLSVRRSLARHAG